MMSKEVEGQLSEIEGKLLYYLRHGPATLKELEEIDEKFIGALGKLKQKGLIVIEKDQLKGKRAKYKGDIFDTS